MNSQFLRHLNFITAFPVLAFGTFLIGFNDCAMAQLWQQRLPGHRSSIIDNRARDAGDTLIIEINESSDVQNKDRRLLNKQGRSAASASGSFSLAGLLGTGSAGLDTDQQTAAQRQLNGNTELKSERGYVDRFSVNVIDVLPNGNMLVSGKRTITLEGDTRTLYVSGIVRRVDVTSQNSIPSQLVSQLEIKLASDGTESKFINQNWLGRAANKWFPF